MLAFGVLTRERAHKAVDWKIIITVASAFGLSTAMSNTRVANVIGRSLTELAISTGTGQIGVLAVVMVFTEILCALITAKAGALLMFPIAADAAYRLDINPITMIIALMLGSSDFSTPQGHQTNLMVYGPGGYVFKDYQKLGIPLEIGLNVVQLLCLAYYDSWYYTTLIAIVFFFICIAIDHLCISRLPLRTLFSVPFFDLRGIKHCCGPKRGTKSSGTGTNIDDDDELGGRKSSSLEDTLNRETLTTALA